MSELGEKLYNDLYSAVGTSSRFKNVKLDFRLPVSIAELSSSSCSGLDSELKDFFQFSNGVLISWDYDLDHNQCGRLNILRLENILESWEDRLHYDGSDERLKYFRPVDIFVEEACCGIVLDESGNRTMYYHTFGDSEIYSLDIDFKGYMELAIEARLFLYWQMYIVELVNGEQPIEIPFKDSRMTEVFPEFDIKLFKDKFEKLRLTK